MDKKNTIIGIALLVAGFAMLFLTPRQPVPPSPQPRPQVTDHSETPSTPSDQPADPTLPRPPAASETAAGHARVEENGERSGEQIDVLENGLVEVRFTNYGGAVKEIVLKGIRKTLESDEPYVMNELRYVPALTLNTYLGEGKNVAYEVVSKNAGSIVYRATLGDQLEVTRAYTLSEDTRGAAGYSISHSIQYRNLGDQPLPVSENTLNLGTVAPSGSQDRFLQTFGYSNGDDVEFIDQSEFLGGGFLGFFSSPPKDYVQGSDNIVWASVKNQFFITILTPEEPVTGFIARPVDFPSETADAPATGLTGSVRLPSFTIPARETVEQRFSYYAGPKEHGRIAQLDKGQEKAMQFGFFGFISKFLLLIMNGLQSMVVNWGVAIILLTIVVRGALLPITLMSMKSMRKMSKLQEPMKQLKEKFPDDTQKQQQYMMELYRINKINPVAGCLPMLAQIPIFFALFYMLRSAAELRFADFLWIQDLSKPDTLFTIPNFPFIGDLGFNLLPFIWLASLAYQMWTMPAPTVENAQFKMMKFMPFIFFPFTYMFSSGLVLYWTVSNVFTIGQQWLVKRGGDDFEVTLPPGMKKALEAGPTKGKRKKK